MLKTKEEYSVALNDWYATAVAARNLEKELVAYKTVLEQHRRSSDIAHVKRAKESLMQLRTDLAATHVAERAIARKVLVFLVMYGR